MIKIMKKNIKWRKRSNFFQLIRNVSLDDFIVYVNKNNLAQDLNRM